MTVPVKARSLVNLAILGLVTAITALLLARRTAANPGPAAREDIQQALNQAYAKYKGLKEGKNADYIPVLAKVDSNLFGIALVTVDGKIYTDRRREVGGLDPIDHQGLHDGAGDRRLRAGGDLQERRRRRHRHAVQLDRRHRGQQGP